MSETIVAMFLKLSKNIVSTLYEITLTWLQATKVINNERINKLLSIIKYFVYLQVIHRQLGAQLMSLFVTAESEEFKHRLKSSLPLLCKYLNRNAVTDGPGRFVRLHAPIKNDQDLDHLIFQCLQTCVKIANVCPSIFSKPSLNDYISNIAS